MHSIDLTAPVGDNRITVKLINPHGDGAGMSYHIYIDNYYQGNVVYFRGEWVGHLNTRSELTMDDLQLLGEIIEKQKAP